jgi:hypothetical protein
MLDLPGFPELDKDALIGACARLPFAIDADRLRSEVEALPPEDWDGNRGSRGVHRAAHALFLRGFAPTKGDQPIEDQPALGQLPYIRWLIETALGPGAQRCLLARLPAGAVIAPHEDTAAYFSKTVRVHVPVATHESVWMVCDGQCYRMRVGEVWALNNSRAHAVWNADDERSRVHLICDFVPSARLLGLLRDSERDLGEVRPDVDAHVQSALPPVTAAAG